MTDDSEYPKHILAPEHLIVQHRGRPHVYEYEYHVDRAGKVWLHVENGAQEAAVMRGPAQAPRVANNTLQYPALATIESWYGAGLITQAQRVAYKLATEMYTQTQVRAARDTLVGTGDVGPT